MSTLTADGIAAPPINREMRTLDRSFFRRTVQVSALSIPESRNISLVRAKVASSRDLLWSANIKPVVADVTNPGSKCVLLRPNVKADDPSTWNAAWSGVVEEGIASIRPYEVSLTYNDWDMGEILDAILPVLESNDEQNPTGFAQIGHVAHLNLRDSFLPYKTLIGQVLLDKNPNIKTVINKLHDVGAESVYRTFPYEVIAGTDDLNVTVRHLNCDFKFNFAEVYWNTRNGHEHERLLNQFLPGQALCDVTAGVGPFAIPAGKKGVWTWANDLNPACHEGLALASSINKVTDYVKTFNLDGATFIRTAAQSLLQTQRVVEKKPKVKLSRAATAAERASALEDIQKRTETLSEPKTFDHFVMNLPATGIEFLRAFRGIYHGHDAFFIGEQHTRLLPMIHLYTFQAKRSTEDEEQKELMGRLSNYLGHDLCEKDEVHLQSARLVAPNKLYYCASFRLPPTVAFSAPDP